MTPHDDIESFLDAINDDFVPAPHDAPGDIRLQHMNGHGHPSLRLRINYDGERRPHEITIRKLDGLKSQIVQWECRLSAHVPTKAIVALLQAA